MTGGLPHAPAPTPAAPIRRSDAEVPPPFAVQFELTYRCNLRCNMCYNGSGEQRAGELSDQEWIDVVADAIECGILEAIISGGEPLLRGPGFVRRLIEMLTEAGVAVHLITNGSRVDRQFVRSLRGLNIQIVQTSIDGPRAAVHDAIRGSNFNDVAAATYLFAQHGFYCRIGTTIQRVNEDCLADMVELAVQLGASEILIDQFLPIGRSIDHYADIATRRTHDDIRGEVAELAERYAHLIAVRQAFTCGDQLRQQAERAVSDSVIVRPNGDLRLGCMAPFTCGSARDGFAKVWAARGALAWADAEVRAFVDAVTDNPGLMAAHRRLGIARGHENVAI